jgi:hypothetical protein
METLNQSLADELLKMAEVDQAMRTKVISGEAEWDSSVDKASQARLKEIVDKEGWPTIPKVGADASRAAWLLVQHAPSLEFMEQCLELMETLPNGEVSPANVAYLKDRVLMMNGKPQIYGTQFQGSGKDMHVYSIEDAEHVDERRSSVGLGAFAENEARLRELYKIDDKK